MQRDLGTLHRQLKYRDLYDAVSDQKIFAKLVAAGWFPFVEIIGSEFRSLADSCEAGFELDNEQARILAKFDSERIERMFGRWMAKAHFAGKERLLRSALKSFSEGDAIPVLKIALTEIEGILGDAYRKIHGKSENQETPRICGCFRRSKGGTTRHAVVSGSFRPLSEISHVR
jgi:hypothetical protein